ncbi:MAG: polysaccharide deacetylase family protein [Betaproteobacteria bacterium]|nr:polysaccharide deacetylase family protein [Betaproteobacteria bacterium]
MRIPVLTYHGRNIFGGEYAKNDHIALAADLEWLDAHGWSIQSLSWVVDWHAGARELPEKSIALTFDDGTDFDFHDLADPEHGPQTGFFNILRAFKARHPRAQPHLNATSFVIASPEARREMDAKCIFNLGWMNDDWWPRAAASGLMDIANHSWDHNNEALSRVAQRNQEKGNFFCIDTREDADRQIRDAAAFISARAGGSAADLFCYPYGHINAYLPGEYFPAQAAGPAPHTRAAFGTEKGFVERGIDRWNLPRFVCGWHWRSPEELADLLAQA